MNEKSRGTTTPKILVLVIHGPYEPWLSILRDGQMKTWMNHETQVNIVNVFGKKINEKLLSLDRKIYFLRWNENKLIAYISLLSEAAIKTLFAINTWKPSILKTSGGEFGDTWTVQMPDSLLLQGVKNLAAFRESLNNDYEYLVTTISSTYLNLKKLEIDLGPLPRKSFVGGRIENSGTLSYQQGSFRVYSRDVVEFLVSKAIKYKHWQIEDIAMGNLVATKYSELTNLSNTSIEDDKELNSELMPKLELICSFRCKSTTTEGIRQDSSIMQRIHGLLNQS